MSSLVRLTVDRRAALVVRRRETEPEVFEAYFRRWEADGPSRTPRLRPDGWVELWPCLPLIGPEIKATQAAALPLLETAATRTGDELFEVRPYRHKQPERVKTIEHPVYRASAWALRHEPSRYEARYFGDLVSCDWETGWRLSVPEVAGMPKMKGFQILTFADSLEAAERVARQELERVVSEGEPIKKRDPGAA